jgi:hypothetical protein
MRKYFLCLLILASALTGMVFAAEIREEKAYTEKTFKEILGNKIVAIDLMKVADNECNLFFFARDSKTRKLEWCYLNSSTGKVISKGSCPFKAFNEYAVSPDGEKAMVSSRYPTAIFELDTKSGSWTNVYSNPAKGKAGLGLLSISPVVFINNDTVFSLLDVWDSEHFVTDSYITLFTSGLTTPEKFFSLNDLKKKAIAEAFGKAPSNWKFMVDFIRLFEDRTMAFVLKSKYPSQSKFSDYLFVMDGEKKLHLLDKNEGGRIFPLDYRSNPVRVLYNRINSGKNEVFQNTGGKKEVIFAGKAIAGRIMENNLIGLAVIDGRSFSIYLGQAGSKLPKIQSFKDPYSVGFSKTGKKLVMVNQKEIRVFKIIP